MYDYIELLDLYAYDVERVHEVIRALREREDVDPV